MCTVGKNPNFCFKTLHQIRNFTHCVTKMKMMVSSSRPIIRGENSKTSSTSGHHFLVGVPTGKSPHIADTIHQKSTTKLSFSSLFIFFRPWLGTENVFQNWNLPSRRCTRLETVSIEIVLHVFLRFYMCTCHFDCLKWRLKYEI